MNTTDKMKDDILDWLINSDDKGISSEAMAAAFLDNAPKSVWNKSTPSDPSDFNRCLKLLILIPEAKTHMGKVANLSDDWKRLVGRWDEVEKCFLDEVGIDWVKGKHLSAHKTYSLMKEIGC